MLFNSIEFALFLPVVWLAYWTLRGRLLLQNLSVADKERFPGECWMDANRLNAVGAGMSATMPLNAVRGENLL